ncbi:MAG: DUF4159 domain-containing protein [Myxococcales bacterium]|nr:DUF4159 domain-containing protein [Myxococcales bacterium]
MRRRSWLDLVGKGLALGGVGAAVDALTRGRLARAFGDDGAFEPKVLLAGGVTGAAHASAPGRWSVELEKRTSAPSRRFPRALKATDPLLLDGPFAYWSGTGGLSPLDKAEIAAMRQFLALGGLLVVDDADPDAGNFGKDARREVARILPDAAPVVVPAEHVLYRTFYLLKPARPWGRANGPATADAIIRAGQVRVLFLSHDLGGALAKNTLGTWEATVEPGGEKQRELAIRFAVNVAMYALTTNYKDDAVHAPYLLKRKTVAP